MNDTTWHDTLDPPWSEDDPTDPEWIETEGDEEDDDDAGD
jgi:hypothetical protein